MAIAALLGSGMRAAGGAMVKSGAKGLAKGMIGRRGKKSQQQQPEVQQVNVKVLNERPQGRNQVSAASSFLSLPSAKMIGSGGAKGVSGVEEKLNLIKNLFAERFAYAKSKSRQDDMEKDRKRKEKREKELEKEEKKAKAQVKSKNALPKVGLFDSIRNFLFYTLLAFLEKRFNFSQMLVKALPVILNVGKFIIDISGKILDGLATFIDFGYGLVDKTREFVKNLGGEGVLQAFDKMLGAINTVLNVLFIYAMAQSAFGGNLGFGGGKKGGSTRPTTRPGQGLRPKVTTTGGRGVNRPDIRNPLRDRPRVTTTGGGTAGRPDIRNPLRSRPTVTTGLGKAAAGEAAEQITKKTAVAAVGKFVTPFVKRIPIFGALVDFAINVALGEDAGRAAARAAGAGIGAWAGGTLGGMAAGAAGSIVPFLGTALGGAVGATFGSIIGGMFGDFLGGWLFDRIVGVPKVQAKTKGGVVRGYEEGGSVEEDVNKKLLKKDDVRILEPKADKENGRGLSKVGDSAALSFVEQSGRAFSKVPIIGPVLALAANKLLGNETDANAFQAISNSLTNFSMLSAAGETKSSGDYEKFTMKYNSGGEVKASGLGLNDPMETSRSLGRFLHTKFNAIQANLPNAQQSTGAQGEGEYDSATGAFMGGRGKTSGSTGSTGGTATGAVAASDLYKEIGADAQQWDLFRNTVALIESGGKYDIYGGSGDHYDGRYQMGKDAKTDGARLAGVEYPGHSDDPNNQARAAYRANPELQETIFTAFTVANHRYLMGNETYASANVERKLEILGYAHNQGMGGAETWMTTGEVGADGFGTKGTKYTDMIAANFRALKSGGELQIAEGAVDVPSLAPGSSPGGDMAADVERGDPSEAASRLLQDFPQIQARANSQQIYASGLGFFLKQSGAGIQGQGDFGNPPGGDMEHPDHGGVVASHKGQGHYKGQALDLGANSATSGSYQDDQKKLWPFISQFLKKYGLDQEPTVPQVIHGPGESFSPKAASSFADGAHHNHFHVEFQGGGLIGKSTKQYGDMSTKASYEKTGSRVMVQPIIIEKQAPQDNFMMNPMDKLTFAGRGRLNNTPAFSRG